MGLNGNFDLTYTLLDHKDGKAEVAIDGRMTGDVNGKAVGSLTIDLDSGWIDKGEMTLEATAEERGEKVKLMANFVFEDGE